MNKSEVKRFAALYERHLKLVKLQGRSTSTIDAYSLAVRRIKDRFNCCPDTLTREQLENYFGDRVESHSYSTLKIDRLGLMFFWKHVLELDWQWLEIVKPTKIQSIQHVLPGGFRRIREYGFLHANARRLRFLLQLILRVRIHPVHPRPRPSFISMCCTTPMVIMAFRRYGKKPGSVKALGKGAIANITGGIQFLC